MKQCGAGHKDRYTDQWNRPESPEINSHICGQMISTRASIPFNRKRTSLQQMVLGKVDIHVEKNEVQWGRMEAQEGEGVGIFTADSRWCMADTNTTL